MNGMAVVIFVIGWGIGVVVSWYLCKRGEQK